MIEECVRNKNLFQRFLRQVCAHPTLSSDSAVQTFLLQNDGWKHIVDTSHVLAKVNQRIHQ